MDRIHEHMLMGRAHEYMLIGRAGPMSRFRILENDPETFKIMKIGSNWVHMPLFGLRIRPNESSDRFQFIGDPPDPQIPPIKSEIRFSGHVGFESLMAHPH